MSDTPRFPNPETQAGSRDFEVTAREHGETDALTAEEERRIIQRLGSLALEASTVLDEHQVDAFGEVVDFFRSGGREAYVKQPTGTGKTVLFVEICKRLIEDSAEGEARPRVIVLEPNIDLVTQTVGSVEPDSGKRRGFKGFAPELDARAHHSQLPVKIRDDNIEAADVLITTYNTFRNLTDRLVVAESGTVAKWRSEKAEHEKELECLVPAIETLRVERSEFMRRTYLADEVARVRRDAGRLLEANQLDKRLPPSQVKNLEYMLAIVDSGESDGIILRQLNGYMKQLMNPRMDQAFKLLKEARKRKPRRRGGPDADAPQAPAGPSEASALTGLSDAEKLIVRFVYKRTYKPAAHTSDLLERQDRQQAYAYNDGINDLRQKITFSRGRAKTLERQERLSNAVKRFNLLILDEVHRSIGTETWEAIREYARLNDIAILGFTATDEYFDRSVEDYFEAKVYDLPRQEAMKREIVNSVAMFVHNTGLRFQNVGLDASGDYDRLTIRQMRLSQERNMVGADYAKLLSEHGYRGIMSAIPGDEGAHAKALAALLNKQEITDPLSGELRPLRARYVTIATPSQLRESYYQAFERGELDWLTFVDVIREGWDSDQAKALINMRPTRSPLLATQRLGRIGRTFEGASVSIVVDLYDGIESQEEYLEIPPVLAADVFEIDGVEQGYIVGSQREIDAPALTALKTRLQGKIVAHHSNYLETLQRALSINGLGILGAEGHQAGRGSEWQTFEAIQKGFEGFLPKEIVLEAASADDPQVRTIKGRRGSKLIPLFNTFDVKALHQDKPEVNPWKLFIDEQGQQWLTPEGTTRLLSKRFPSMRPEDVVDLVRQVETETGQAFDKNIGRVRLSFGKGPVNRMGLTFMFKLDEVMDRLVPRLGGS